MDWIRRLLGGNAWAAAAALFPVAADAVHWWLFDPLNERMRALLVRPGGASAFGLLGLYAAWLATLALVGRLAPEAPPPAVEMEVRGQDGRRGRLRTTWPKLLFFYPSLLFGAMWMVLVAQALGLEQTVAPVSDRLQSTLLLLGVGLFLAHCVIAAVEPAPRLAAGTPGHFAVLVPVVLVGEVALNLATAAWLTAFGPDPSRPAQAAAAAQRSGAEFALALVLFLLCFAGPRFTFLYRSFTWPALLSGLAFVAWEVWATLDRVALL